MSAVTKIVLSPVTVKTIDLLVMKLVGGDDTTEACNTMRSHQILHLPSRFIMGLACPGTI